MILTAIQRLTEIRAAGLPAYDQGLRIQALVNSGEITWNDVVHAQSELDRLDAEAGEDPMEGGGPDPVGFAANEFPR